MFIIPFINLIFVFIISLVLTCYAFFIPSHKSIESSDRPEKIIKPATLPPSPFKFEKQGELGSGPLELTWVTPKLELPDLRNDLIYYGKNGRPDFKEGKALMHISFKGCDESKTVCEKSKVYLTVVEGKYGFSPHNQITSLWLELSGNDDFLNATVWMIDENQTLVKTPENFHSFAVKAEEFKNTVRPETEVGGHRVDGGLLMRQHARFAGKDLFLERHGGPEFDFALNRERIDFTMDQNFYSIFIHEGDLIVWKEGEWILATKESDTTQLPLLVVKKIDERIITFEFWDKNGKGKIPLSLIRHKTHDPLPDVSKEFKFVGAKTWAQFIVECGSKRFVLKEGDWLVLTQSGWQKIGSPQDVDDYVSQKIQGPLFVLDKLVKQEGKQILMGHLFNSSRTEMQEVELKAFGKEKEKEAETEGGAVHASLE